MRRPNPSRSDLIRALALCTVFLAGCSDDPAGPGETKTPNVAVESSNRVQETIGPEGGSLSTTSNAGIAYTLDIPAGALPGEVTVTMTPVTSIKGLPFAGGIEGAVQLQPSGLNLLAPAVLTIGATASPSGLQRLVGFLYEGDAAAFELSPGGAAGGEMRVLVSHFSGAGAALADPGNIGDCEALGPNEPLVIVITTCVEAGDRTAFLDLMQRVFDDLIEPAVQNGTGDALQDGIREYLTWRVIVEGGLAEVYNAGDAETVFVDRILSIETTISTKIENGIAAAKAQCTPGDLQWLIEVFEFRALAIAVFEGLPPGLDNLIFTDLCATAIVESTELADPLPLNQDRSLDIDFALEIDGTPTDAVFAVTVTDPDNLVRTPTGRTDAQGRYTTVVRRLIEEGAYFDIGATLILPLFGVSGLALTEVPITVEDQVFRGGNARITANLPSAVTATTPVPLTITVERLTNSGYEPVVDGQVTLSVDGGTADQTQLTTDAGGIVETTVTASEGAGTLIIDISVSLDGLLLGSRRVEATISEVVISLRETYRGAFAFAAISGACSDSDQQRQDETDPFVQLSRSAAASCTINDTAGSAFASMIQNCNPNIAADGKSAIIQVTASGTGTATASDATEIVAVWENETYAEVYFTVAGGPLKYSLAGSLDPEGEAEAQVVLHTVGGSQIEVVKWRGGTGGSGGNSLSASGDLPTAPGGLVMLYRLVVTTYSTGENAANPTGSHFFTTTLTLD